MECSGEQHRECALEVSGDSEEVCSASMAVEEEDKEGDDAESCIDGDDDDSGNVGEEIRWSSWRSWCEECAVGYETTGEGNGYDAPREKSTVETEENRLFWEACLGDEYSGQE